MADRRERAQDAGIAQKHVEPPRLASVVVSPSSANVEPGKKQTLSFTLNSSDFGFYDNRGKFVVEPGRIDVYAGDSSNADLMQSFTVSG